MSVESVNNNSNAGLYAAGAALLGGGAGAAIGYTTKSILKDGNYTDEFISKAHKEMMNSDMGKAASDLFAIDSKSETFFKDIMNVLKKHHKALGIDAKEAADMGVDFAASKGGKEYLRDFLEIAKSNIEAEYPGEEIKFGKDSNISELIKKHVPEDLDEVFDRSKKTFKSNIKESNPDVLEAFKSAQKNIKLKAAGIYGAIGAGILGLGTYLCCSGKKEAPQQTIDTQA